MCVCESFNRPLTTNLLPYTCVHCINSILQAIAPVSWYYYLSLFLLIFMVSTINIFLLISLVSHHVWPSHSKQTILATAFMYSGWSNLWNQRYHLWASLTRTPKACTFSSVKSTHLAVFANWNICISPVMRYFGYLPPVKFGPDWIWCWLSLPTKQSSDSFYFEANCTDANDFSVW